MRPVPIPDDAVWDGGVRRVIAPPGGDLTHPDIAPVDAIIDRGLGGVARVNILVQLEPGDLETLQQTGHLWLSVLGGIHPFALTAAPPANHAEEA
ncbi:hypothetical protein [Nocardioides zeae]